MRQSENNSVKDAIKAYLDKKASEDALFAAAYAKPNKSIDECFKYILGEVQKEGNAVYKSDMEVFGMAVHYYDEDNIKINNLPKGCRVTSSAPVELTDKEKEQAKAEAIAAYQKQCVEDWKAKEKEAKRKRMEKAREAYESTPSLFKFE